MQPYDAALMQPYDVLLLLLLLFIYQNYDIYIQNCTIYKPYSDNNEHHGSVALTDAQHEIRESTA